MRSLHLSMAWEEWERMPWRFGWKHEYWNGHAHLTPRQNHVHVRLRRPAASRVAVALPAGLSSRSVEPTDGRGLIDSFIETFEGGVEFCDWPVEKVHEHARRNIGDYFAGLRGTPLLAASRLALGEGGEIVGAVLLAARETGPNLDLLMVRPGLRRRGVANALVGTAVEKLRASNASSILRSAHSVSNEESTIWHRAFGFEEEPDLYLARLRRAFYAHETARHKGLETDEARRQHPRLSALYEYWSRRTEELEEVAEREGSGAVMPALRYGW